MPHTSITKAALILLLILLSCLAVMTPDSRLAAETQKSPPKKDAAKQGSDKQDLGKLAQQSSNPVGELWMITNQFNFNMISSEKVKPFEHGQMCFNWNLQPVLPFDLNEDVRLVTRPVIPLYNKPYLVDPYTTRDKFGLGDIELVAMLAPINDSGKGFMWGIGPTAVFPTATDKVLGQGKWQLGVAAAGLYLDEKWVLGVFPQHWWSVGGDDSRDRVCFTNLQYFLWWSPAPTWQIGMAPNVYIDWTQKESEDRLTLPIGIGVSKLVKFGRLPVKFALEFDYSIIRPDNIPGNEWTIKLNITPILPKLL